MNNISKEQILDLCKKYDSENQLDNSVEKRLGSNFITSKEMSKEELKKVIQWKFNDNKARLKRELNLVDKNDDTTIKELSKCAFNTGNDDIRIKHLCNIKGIGPAVASAILTFYDPKNFGVFDIHVYDELFDTDSKTRPDMSNPELYIKLLNKLREEAINHNLNVRIIEKAYYQKNIDKARN